MHRPLPVLALLLTVASAAAAASGPPELQPLLRIRVEGFDVGAAVDFAEDWSLFRDGLLVHEFRVPEDNYNELLRGRGAAAEVARLQTALLAAKVGLQGDCRIELDPDALVSDQSRIVWFGRGERRKAFTVERDYFGTSTPCPDAVVELMEELRVYRSLVAAKPETVDVIFED
ncbi:MAG: hypothetical protein ACRD2T_05850 [Thermoanaerobaculia bacterium]